MAASSAHAASTKGGRQLRLDGVALFSRTQAARFLGMTVRQIRWLEETGQLHPSKSKGGGRVFRREDLEAYLNAQPGALAARAFRCFEGGMSPQQTVIELQAMPAEIAKLHAEWVNMSGAWVVAGPKGSRAQWERIYGIGELTPIKLRTALELVGSNPALRDRLHDPKAA